MNAATTSEISPTKSSDDCVRAFATLRFVGDELDPDEISRILAEKPTKAHRKDELFSQVLEARRSSAKPASGISAPDEAFGVPTLTIIWKKYNWSLLQKCGNRLVL
jgi:hypothetical protein